MNSPLFEPETAVDPILDAESLARETLYVNAKQFHRIVKRRMARHKPPSTPYRPIAPGVRDEDGGYLPASPLVYPKGKQKIAEDDWQEEDVALLLKLRDQSLTFGTIAAQYFPRRTEGACRARYSTELRTLEDEGIDTGLTEWKWNLDDVEVLWQAHREFGQSFNEIAEMHLPERTAKACEERFYREQKKREGDAKLKQHDHWDSDEEQLLLDARAIGLTYPQIVTEHFPWRNHVTMRSKHRHLIKEGKKPTPGIVYNPELAKRAPSKRKAKEKLGKEA